MNWTQKNSQKLFSQAKKIIPGGVNSPVRAFGNVDGEPLFMTSARGAYLTDADGQKYVDYINSWGPAILGHAHPEVLIAINSVMQNGLTFGAPTELETKLAEKIQKALPSLEMMRMVSSGTEACMAALRVARGYTKRSKILKFEGCYHGHADFLLVKAGSGAATFGTPTSPGIPLGTAAETLVCPYNDVEKFAEIMQREGDQLAAVILEPIVGNSGFIRPSKEFLESLQKLCSAHGSLLVFDEVMTGFRVAWGGAQTLFNIVPDMTILGKVVGGGLPLAVYGGRKEIMSVVSPIGPVYQAGTLSGNPLSVTAGLKTLEILEQDDVFGKLSKSTALLVAGLKAAATQCDIPFVTDSQGGMFGFFFSEKTVCNFADAANADQNLFKEFFWGMLKKGFYFAPSSYEAGFVSAAHTSRDIEDTISAAREVFATLRR